MEKQTDLSAEIIVDVRFNEVDPLGIVWHGHYVRYFEDAREAFGRKYGISYMQVYAQGYAVPLVSINCDYKQPLRYEDKVKVVCRYINTAAAKLIFSFQAFLEGDGKLVAEGKSVQVFVDKQGVLQLYAPEFFEQWKKKYGIER